MSAPVGVDGLLADLETIWHSIVDDKETNAAYQRLKSALSQQPAAEGVQAGEVYVDFPQVGIAGPFPVEGGKVTLPDVTMNDLIHHARIGYVKQHPEARGVVDASILHEAGDVLEAVAMSGVSLPNNWRWPLADELRGMAAALTGERNG